jgi:release factor glutamine methyltransferase
MVERRLAGEPLQYVLGSWSFRGLDLMVDHRVLIPRPETEWVVEVALEEAARVGLRRGARAPLGSETSATVADLGTGSGAIALALESELADVEVWATDASADALAVAAANVAGCGAARVRLAEGSWFDALPSELAGTLALVVANPPYVAAHELDTLAPEVAGHEPHDALVSGPTGLEAIEVLLAQAPAWLAPGAAVVLEIAPHQADAAAGAARVAGFDDVRVLDDFTFRPRVLVARGIACTRMADDLDVEAMLARFRERADAVRNRPLPPVAGPDRQRFIDNAQTDFMDFAIVADATWSLDDGVLTLRVDLRPER